MSPIPVRAPIWICALFGGFGLLFVAFGWTAAIVQHIRLATYVPVTARVIWSRLTSYSERDELAVQYAYTVGGRVYENHRVVSGDRGCVAGQYPAGASITVWHSPSDPAKSSLSHEFEGFPYFLCVFLAVFPAIGLSGIILRLRSGRPPVPPVPAGDGWFRLAAQGTLRARFRVAAVATIAWYSYCALAIGHYLIVSGDGPDAFVYGSSLACAAIGCVGLVPSWRLWRLGRCFRDTELCIVQGQLHPGDSFRFRISQQVIHPVELQELRVGLVCMRDDRERTRERTGASVRYFSIEASSDWQAMALNRQYGAGGCFEAEGEATLSPTACPSSPASSRAYPFYRWRITVRLIARGQPELKVHFPLQVDAPASLADRVLAASTRVRAIEDDRRS